MFQASILLIVVAVRSRYGSTRRILEDEIEDAESVVPARAEDESVQESDATKAGYELEGKKRRVAMLIINLLQGLSSDHWALTSKPASLRSHVCDGVNMNEKGGGQGARRKDSMNANCRSTDQETIGPDQRGRV